MHARRNLFLLGLAALLLATSGLGCPSSSSCKVDNPCDTEFEVRCVDGATVETCTRNADNCLGWVEQPCATGMICEEGAGCMVACEHECDPYTHPSCSADGMAIETCELQNDGCFDLFTADCDAGLVCDDSGDEPVCVCVDDCDPEMYPACSEDMSAVETCVEGLDGCYDLVSTGCGASAACDDSGDTPECVNQCADECDPNDYPACSASGYAVETCELQADECTHIVATDCGAGEACDAGTTTCQSTGCADGCDPDNYPVCGNDGASIDSCERQADGCYDMVNTACGANEVCDASGGAPVCGCVDDCDPNGYPACSASGFAVETCVAGADTCFDLVVTDCGAEEACNANSHACEATGCSDDCDPNGYPVCNDDGVSIDTCERQADGCYDAINTACGADLVCDATGDAPACVCTNECVAADYPACSGDTLSVETCEQQGDGCYDLISTACQGNEICNPNTFTCAVPCTDDCDPDAYPICSNGNMTAETCVQQGDGCYDLITQDCVYGEICVDATPGCDPDPSCSDAVTDGSFEGATPNADWTEGSTNFGTPLCDVATCGDASGNAGPMSGDWFGWFGGTQYYEEGLLSQQIRIPMGATAPLSFYFDIAVSADEATDVFTVDVDGDVLFTADSTESATYDGYTLIELDLAAYADGAAHVLSFFSVTDGVGSSGSSTSFLIDDVNLLACGGTCVHECDLVDELACSPDMFEVLICQAQGDGCNDWVQSDDCVGNGEQCDPSADPIACIPCINECPAVDASGCIGDVRQTCVAGPDGCFDWQAAEDCTSNGQYCNDSADPAVCADLFTMTAGDNCDDAGLVPLSVPAELPAQDLNQATCGRGNDYEDTCLGGYDGGEDVTYQIDVTEPTAFNISLDPKGTDYTGMAIGMSCPLGASCDFGATNPGTTPYETGCQYYLPGLYSLMVDTYPTPDCIPDFDLSISACLCGEGQTTCLDGTTIGICNANNDGWDAFPCGGGCGEVSPGMFRCYVTPAAAGDLVITEIMQDPAAVNDNEGEWFEVYNPATEPANLNGLTFQDDGGDSFTVNTDVFVPATSYGVLARNGDPAANGGVTPIYDYAGAMSLANGADEIEIIVGGVTIDRVAYTGNSPWPDPTGASMSLDSRYIDATENDDGARWCPAINPFGDGDLGTPGAANPVCLPTNDYFSDDCELDQGWTSVGDWDWGTPDAINFPSGPAACAGGTGCYGTGMDANYSNSTDYDTNNASFGPVDLSAAATDTYLIFDMWLDMENTWDGARVEASVDGTTWTLVPVITPAYNWHDPADAWTGTLGGPAWQMAVGDLTSYNGGMVYVRFAIDSDGTVGHPGMYVDNVRVAGY